MGLFKKQVREVIKDGVIVSEEVKPKNNKSISPVIVVKQKSNGGFGHGGMESP